MNLVNKRRSIRKYTDRPASREHLMKCIEAARLAPSACNSQPWKFIIVDNPALKNKLCDKIFNGIYSFNKFANEAPALIIVISEREKFLSAVGGKVRDTRYYLIDIGIASEHLVLQAAELGLGSCYIGWFDEKALKNILKIPSSKKVDLVISIGYPANAPLPHKTRKPLSEIAEFV